MKTGRASTVRAVFLSAAVVAAGHALLSGGADPAASVSFGLAGGFGALVLDIWRTLAAGRCGRRNGP
ncbi:hypothetical protein [Rhodovulum kholense]|uniref:Secreted protein n=1 Tax=Rhodovulum kholense TaxID=453584 RepID=A0A8E2VHX1_9RHOB|nr:hypothetical protein [Rhodovulum kholense]PTW46594.1 hypothetical protein C8N38_11178 [Rhodovulum kholense]